MSRPAVPLCQFAPKVHSCCDLGCDHCYVYQRADQSWRGRPTANHQTVLPVDSPSDTSESDLV
jgi:uncharacterized protein